MFTCSFCSLGPLNYDCQRIHASHWLHPKTEKSCLRRTHFKVGRHQGTSESKVNFTSCLMRYIHLIDYWRQHRCILRCLWYPTIPCVPFRDGWAKNKDGIWKYSEVYTVNTVEQALTLRAVSELDVTRTITYLKPSRAKDIFGMDVIKELSESLVNPITKIINLSVSQGMFPCAWKSSVIVPIFKSGDPHSASNYRPISILPIVSKVAEKLMAAQITNYLNNSYFALHPMQFGFRANYSTEMANCYFTEKVKSLLDKGGVIGAVFLDLRKAFDTLNHRIILSKLLSFNFSPHTLRWIESYLSGRTQYVSIQNYNSAPLSISTGVPQGSILGPLLFTLYINDLPSVCPNTNIQMYADDTVIYIQGSSVTSCKWTYRILGSCCSLARTMLLTVKHL